MRKDGFRLSMTHRKYDPNRTTTLHNDVDAILSHLLSVKILHHTFKDSETVATGVIDHAIAAEMAAHDTAQQALLAMSVVAHAAWNHLAYAAQVAAGAQPPLHVVVVFALVPDVRQQRIDTLRNQLAVDMIVAGLRTGAAVSDFYELAASVVSANKVTQSHSIALLATTGALQLAIQGCTAAQAHPAVIDLLMGAILANWRAAIQGYTATEMAKAGIMAVEMTLIKPICAMTVHDDTTAHCNAFATINTTDAVGFSKRLAASVVHVCEPGLRTRFRTCQTMTW
jgi:hypothetical protein